MKRTREKTICRAALVNLPADAAQIFRGVFTSYKITAVAEAPFDFTEEKYDAAVLELSPANLKTFEVIRTSPMNRNMIIYGLGTPETVFKDYSRFGPNAFFPHPLERSAVIKAVKSTHLLVLHEYRRYARIPVMVEITVNKNGTRYHGTTIEISGGGMSFAGVNKVVDGDRVEVTVNLPSLGEVKIPGTICWIGDSDQSCGLKFDPDDPHRAAIRTWVDGYLDIR